MCDSCYLYIAELVTLLFMNREVGNLAIFVILRLINRKVGNLAICNFLPASLDGLFSLKVNEIKAIQLLDDTILCCTLYTVVL